MTLFTGFRNPTYPRKQDGAAILKKNRVNFSQKRNLAKSYKKLQIHS